MATSVPGVLPENLRVQVQKTKIFVVGAGGIGCELLKNLVLSGFEDIELVAKDSALKFNPNAKIVAYHDNIMSADYGVQFFKRFTMVMNALDNRAARNHVNRMCLAADVPLIESGTAGYLGQVTVIKKNMFECYECKPAAPQKTYPGCTIRNTPSEPIHCIVWAKHLFNQLFGEEDPDQDVSPDTEDPEAAGDAGQAAAETEAKSDAIGGIERKSTRTWAQETGYNSEKIFNKLFRDDIKYLLSMDNLWKKRRPPVALDLGCLPQTAGGSGAGLIQDQRVWSVQECADVFCQTVPELAASLEKEGEGGMLVWDKDDKAAMDFVTSAANVRAHIFGIPMKSRFDIKSMAGNIIPAIATTNAIIAALIVMEGLKILQGRLADCRTVVLYTQPNWRKKLLDPGRIEKPNPKCYVCSEKPEITVALNTMTMTVRGLDEKVLKSALGMVAPDVEIDDGKGTIVISSEEGETDENMGKHLEEFGIKSGTRLKCDDFLQEYNINVNIVHVDKLPEEKEFELMGDPAELQAKLEKGSGEKQEPDSGPSGAATNAAAEEDDDLVVMDDEEPEVPADRKRKADEPPAEGSAAKKRKPDSGAEGESHDEDVIVL